ncbi:isochorismate synthase [Microbacter margulisiae]|uniref:isochorismate synthase n=1 Tax=Microbacter margulisiae TaxID=1350067 RepID=A0A7W5DRH5_9PORP|nr:isochorismate synthase [Microbacter margulisiae]MBB3187706.1 isochorismate synthase [Microbacter margulisiae]
MNFLQLHIDTIDQLIGKELGIALYRLPGSEEPTLLLSFLNQIEQQDDYAALNDVEGFVMAPFYCNALHPVLVLHPEVIISGIKNMETFLQSDAMKRWVALPQSHSAESACQAIDSEKKAYEISFQRFLQALTLKEADKLVLSRYHVESRSENIKPTETFLKACNRYPDAFVYLCYTPVSGLWLGSTPEMLLSGVAPHFHTVALAGTKPAAIDGKVVRWDTKNRQEQQWVVTYLKELFSDLEIEWHENQTHTIKAGNVIHLKTSFDFEFSQYNHLGDLLKKLHPTPAVCGFPKEKAYRFIVDNEGYNRKYYSGFVGVLSKNDQTNLYVNLRCMEWTRHQTILYAGGGLLVSSQLHKEWKETEDKLQTMLNILHDEAN